MGKKINNLESLDREISKLRTRTKELEKELDGKLDFLQDNYSSMMMKSFLPAIGQKGGVAGSILQFVFQNERLQDSVLKLAERLFNKVSDGLEFIVNKIDGKK
jgi:hypothetical protein